MAFAQSTVIADDSDFDSIEAWTKASGANVMIGNSDGRRIAERLDIPLVRCAFPVHDQIGGQRLRLLGYDGSLAMLDRITNEILLKVETGYRGEMYEKYYQGETNAPALLSADTMIKDAASRSASHPCFNGLRRQVRPHPPAYRARLQHPVQLLRAQVRLCERIPSRRHQRGPFAAGSSTAVVSR